MIGGRIRAKLIAGRKHRLDRYRLYEKLGDQGNWVDIITFDDLLAHLEFFRAQSMPPYEGLLGISIHFAGAIHRTRSAKRNYLMSVGSSIERNFITSYVDDRSRVCVEVSDEEGSGHIFKTHPLGSFSGGRPTYLTFEIAFSRDYAVTSIELEGKYQSVAVCGPMVLDLNRGAIVLGADSVGNGGGWFDLDTFFVFDKTLTLNDRGLARTAMMSFLPEDVERRAQFRGHFMRTNGHPCFPFDESCSGMDMIQPVRERQPTLSTSRLRKNSAF